MALEERKKAEIEGRERTVIDHILLRGWRDLLRGWAVTWPEEGWKEEAIWGCRRVYGR